MNGVVSLSLFLVTVAVCLAVTSGCVWVIFAIFVSIKENFLPSFDCAWWNPHPWSEWFPDAESSDDSDANTQSRRCRKCGLTQRRPL